ncbi:hypothetical protein NCS57_00826300 [Fusarium keratoplasticum]|uniref:Uncharacterized protein n=1 Tax=Fusarium keratoplasticum TaxID=1328300 RepID=A0ACC0QVB2_9HYPO|nr:hypothetical protein NCS57_00826300 [Fusarium keratoplasticum]KAI8666030.1 hypothetical protein NCS57_00826300 [Fusarium keratoplasticum]
MPDGQEIVPRAFSGKTRRGSLGIYFACLDLALRVMQTSWVVKIRSIGDFWVTLERRCTERGIPPYPVPLPPMIHEDFNILENNTSCSVILGTERYYLPHYCMYEYRNYYHSGNIWWEADPLYIPNFTSHFVYNLKPHEQQDSDHIQFSKLFRGLPREIKDQIINLLPQRSLPIDCTYLMPQDEWKHVFINIPFLWDLDHEAIHKKTHSAPPNTEWDWEKLTRQS